MALITLADYKTFEGITGTAQDTRLQLIIDAATAWVETYCGRDFEASSKTETHSGGTSTIRLLSPPINSITSISVLSSTGTVSGTIATTEILYDSETGILSTVGPVVAPAYSDEALLLGTVFECPIFPPGFRNIQVVYNGGYSGAVPKDLQMGVFAVVDWMSATRGTAVSMKSETIGAYSYNKDDSAGTAPDHVLRLIAPYRMIG